MNTKSDMRWQDFVKDYFRFTRKERIGVITVVLVIILLLSLPALVKVPGSRGDLVSDTAWMAELRSLEVNTEENRQNREGTQRAFNGNNTIYERHTAPAVRKPPGELFYFDPNTANADTWEKLGLRSKIISTILRFIEKGGKFRNAADLKKIYGLFPDEFERLAPYIQITTAVPPSFRKEETRHFPAHYRKEINSVDVNASDTSDWIALPGIGSKLANRIIQFREKLGGFHDIKQVAEIYGLTDSTFQTIRQSLKLGSKDVKKLNINSASVDELKSHPYIRFAIANAIVAYRNQHGLFSSLDELNKLMPVTPEIYQKMIPYLITKVDN